MSDGWHDDPYGRYPKRYYDGTQWTTHVADHAGTTQTDPYGTQPSPGGMPTAPPVGQMPASAGAGGFRALPGSPVLRFLARIIDSIIIGVPLYLLLDALGIGFDFGGLGEDGADFEVPVAAYLIQFVVFAVYEIYMVANFGRTIGKMAMGLTVVKGDDCSLPGYGVATVRYLAWLVYVIPFVILISIFMAFSNAKRQTIHDKIASTLVAKSSSLK